VRAAPAGVWQRAGSPGSCSGMKGKLEASCRRTTLDAGLDLPGSVAKWKEVDCGAAQGSGQCHGLAELMHGISKAAVYGYVANRQRQRGKTNDVVVQPDKADIAASADVPDAQGTG